MMEKSPDSMINYWLVNGWMIVLLLVVVFFMAALGFFDYFISSGYSCDLGDSFRCNDFTAFTDEKTVSYGDLDDYISFKLTNKQTTAVKDLIVSIESCSSVDLVNKTLQSGQTVNITSYFCENLRPGYSTNLDINLSYSVLNGGVEYQLKDFGHIDVFVETIQHETMMYKFKRWITNGIKENIG
jgi:hypothetical protein